MPARTRVRILSGAGRYADPWHDFDGTTGVLAELIGARPDTEVEVRHDVEDAMADLTDVGLLVVNVGDPAPPGQSAPSAAAQAGLADYVRSGAPLWAHHAAATSFPGMPLWEQAIGGRWVEGTSMHPPIGTAHILIADSEHPVTAGITDFEVWDERYTHLRVSGDVRVLAFHEHEGARHPLLWTLDDGARRAAYDALGHTVDSCRHPVRQELLRRTRDWLLGAQ